MWFRGSMNSMESNRVGQMKVHPSFCASNLEAGCVVVLCADMEYGSADWLTLTLEY